MWENRGGLKRGKKESFLLVRPLLDHFAGFVWSTKIGCRDGLSEHTFRETDGLVMWLCLRFVRSPMPLSEAGHGVLPEDRINSLYIRHIIVVILRH